MIQRLHQRKREKEPESLELGSGLDILVSGDVPPQRC